MTEVRPQPRQHVVASNHSVTLMDDDDGIVLREVQDGRICNTRSGQSAS